MAGIVVVGHPWSADRVAWSRIHRSGLVTPFGSPREVARRLSGIQAQFLPAAGLSASARLADGFTDVELDGLLNRERELVRIWGHRNTLHVYDVADWATVVAASDALPSYRQRLTKLLGRTDEEFEEVLSRMTALLVARGRVSRGELVDADPFLEPWLRQGNIPMLDLVRRGVVCHAGGERSHSYFAHRASWVPELDWAPPTRDEAGRALALRYYESYGPASVQDLAFWLGARVSDSQRWVDAISDRLVEVPLERGGSLLDARPPKGVGEDAAGRGDPPQMPASRAAWPLRLLYRYDPLLLAHREKGWLVDEDQYKAVWREAAIVEAVILKRGRIAGVWGYKRRARAVDLWLAPFARLTKKDRRAIEREGERVAEYFGTALGKVGTR